MDHQPINFWSDLLCSASASKHFTQRTRRVLIEYHTMPHASGRGPCASPAEVRARLSRPRLAKCILCNSSTDGTGAAAREAGAVVLNAAGIDVRSGAFRVGTSRSSNSFSQAENTHANRTDDRADCGRTAACAQRRDDDCAAGFAGTNSTRHGRGTAAADPTAIPEKIGPPIESKKPSTPEEQTGQGTIGTQPPHNRGLDLKEPEPD